MALCYHHLAYNCSLSIPDQDSECLLLSSASHDAALSPAPWCGSSLWLTRSPTACTEKPLKTQWKWYSPGSVRHWFWLGLTHGAWAKNADAVQVPLGPSTCLLMMSCLSPLNENCSGAQMDYGVTDTWTQVLHSSSLNKLVTSLHPSLFIWKWDSRRIYLTGMLWVFNERIPEHGV